MVYSMSDQRKVLSDQNLYCQSITKLDLTKLREYSTLAKALGNVSDQPGKGMRYLALECKNIINHAIF